MNFEIVLRRNHYKTMIDGFITTKNTFFLERTIVLVNAESWIIIANYHPHLFITTFLAVLCYLVFPDNANMHLY